MGRDNQTVCQTGEGCICAQASGFTQIMPLIHHECLDEGSLFSVNPSAIHIYTAALNLDNKT